MAGNRLVEAAQVAEEGDFMTFTATPAFARTRCRDCGTLIEVGQQVTSAADGFRHGSCAVRAISPGHELELAQAG